VTISLMQIDLALRSGGLALACLLAVLFAMSGTRTVARYGTLFALGVGGYLTCSWTAVAQVLGAWRWPLVPLCLVVPALFWLYARALFEDEFEPGYREAGAVAALLALGAAMIGLDGPAHQIAGVALRLLGLALVAHALWVVIRGRAGDLVEPRRRFRAPFVLLSGLYVAMVGIAEIVLAGAPASIALSALNALGIFTLTFVSTAYFTVLRPEIAVPSPHVADAAPQPTTPPPGATTASPSDDDILLAKLRDMMERDRAYRTDGLTIGGLADKLGTQEYLLRRLINGRLGHRNFNAFLNGYRLAEAKAALADPSQAEVPILTIALDAGFASLGPFNRAFKAETGLTPSAFRRNPPPSAP
jgi:AraC-like DNA-binding protein